MKPLKVLWVGPYVPDAHLRHYRSTSPAACFWQQGLLQALVGIGVDVKLFSRPVVRAWPGGCLVVRTDGVPGMEGVETHYFDHPNLKRIRDKLLASAYMRRLRGFLREGWSPDVVVTYNALPEHVLFALEARNRLGIPWVCTVADLSSETDDLTRPEAGGASGVVYLSYYMYQACAVRSKLHLDGGIDVWRGMPNVPVVEGSLLCSGSLGAWGGEWQLLEAFRALDIPEKRLWITGRPQGRQAVDPPGVERFGLLARDELEELAHLAAAFVNAKPRGLPGNAANFPSKLLDYLSYGKPIVTTWTDGIHPMYRDLVIPVEEDGPCALADGMRVALTMSAAEREGLRERVRALVMREKLWAVQAARLTDWLVTSVVGSAVAGHTARHTNVV